MSIMFVYDCVIDDSVCDVCVSILFSMFVGIVNSLLFYQNMILVTLYHRINATFRMCCIVCSDSVCQVLNVVITKNLRNCVFFFFFVVWCLVFCVLDF